MLPGPFLSLGCFPPETHTGLVLLILNCSAWGRNDERHGTRARNCVICFVKQKEQKNKAAKTKPRKYSDRSYLSRCKSPQLHCLQRPGTAVEHSYVTLHQLRIYTGQL